MEAEAKDAGRVNAIRAFLLKKSKYRKVTNSSTVSSVTSLTYSSVDEFRGE